jgi:hypothetical protein
MIPEGNSDRIALIFGINKCEPSSPIIRGISVRGAMYNRTGQSDEYADCAEFLDFAENY